MRRLTLPGAILLFMVVLYVFLLGVQQFAAGVRFSSPVTLTYAEYMKQRPTEGWYRITDGVEWMSEYRGRIGPSKLPLIPLRGPQTPGGTVEVFVDPANAGTLAIFSQLDAAGSPAARAAFVKHRPDMANVTAPIEGTIVPSLDPEAFNLTFAMGQFGDVDRSHATILVEGATPQPVQGAILAFIAVFFGFLIYRWYSWSVDPFREERVRLAMHSIEQHSQIEQIRRVSSLGDGQTLSRLNDFDGDKPASPPGPTNSPAKNSADVPWWEQSSSTNTPKRQDQNEK